MRVYQPGVRQGLAGLLTVLLLLGTSGVANAITPNDIRTWYGVGLQQDVRPLLAELREVARKTRTAEVTELYNSVLASYPMDELNSAIDSGIAELQTLANDMESGLDLPFEDLLALEQRYYVSRDKLNAMLGTRDVIANTQPSAQEEDIDALHESIAELEKAIQTAGVYEDIGRLGVWPAEGVKRKYNSGFGSRWDPVTNDKVSYHSGVDIYATMATTVIAEFSGTVYKTGYSYTSGNYIYLDHGYGVRTFYCHLSKVSVSKGDNIRQGMPIALSGNTGSRTTGPHLHFGIYIDGSAVDPKVVLEHG